MSADFLQFLRSLRGFADTCHHRKEEGLLFPAMIEAGLPAIDRSVSVMLSEHEHGRALVTAMAGAIEAPASTERFSDLAAEYAQYLRSHIEKENTAAFPRADRLVASDVMNGVVDAFEIHEEEVMGAGRHDELHDMLQEMKAKYLDS